VRVWDLQTGRCRAVLEGHTGAVDSVAVSADGRTAVSWSYDRTARVWDLQTGRCERTYPRGSEEAGRAWAVSGQERSFTARFGGHFLVLQATSTDAAVARYPGTFTHADCSADGRHIVAGDGRGQVYLLRLHTRGRPP
jgi:WD40 repeat protein